MIKWVVLVYGELIDEMKLSVRQNTAERLLARVLE